MASATYLVGPSDFFTPGDLEADAATLNGQVSSLDAQIEGNEAVPQTFVDQWTSFEAAWGSFYSSSFSGYLSSLVSALNDSNRDALISYENQFAAFAAQASSFGATLVAPVAPSNGSGDTIAKQLSAQTGGLSLPSLTSIAVVAVAVIVILVVWKV
jgi:hypothetical protein